ncbi:MAG: phosphonate C-P lyase system protein PhnG, partial [Gammaproteobacteria bacterium]|nr:phosphonate C-P lyase system protein PhnG [Gammaproteobacteria bacterium]
MFHAFDNLPADRPLCRPDWMALLARAPVALLEPALAQHTRIEPQWLRPPETGLMMVQGRAGGTGERFNLGEVTVTRCALRVGGVSRESAKVGVAY